jgi:hypothetical protein
MEAWVNDNIDALGNLANAALVARSLEPEGGLDHAAAANAHNRCANCDAPLSGNFCANCGQKAHVHRSLAHVGEEILHGVTHFDGKAWTTLPLLIFRPGKLTRDYIEGKRTRYIAPVPLFLLIVFLMFFVFSFVKITDNIGGGATNDAGQQMTRAEAKVELPKIEAELADIDRQIAEARKNPEPGQLAALNGARIGVVTVRDRMRARANGEVETPLDIPGELAREISDSNPSVNLGNKSLNEKAEIALKNPELVLYKIQGKAYKLSFLLVPLSLPWLWLMFAWKRDVRMYDHAVFALYSISFMSLLFILASGALTLGITSGWFWTPMLLAPFVHMYAQLKGTYSLRRFSALWRTAALWTSAIITLSIYAALMIALGVLD